MGNKNQLGKKNQLGVFSTTLDKKKIKERKFRYKNQNRKDAWYVGVIA